MKESEKRRIFLTTIDDTKNRLDIEYFACDQAPGGLSYTTGISVAEAGIKYILSRQEIDEIVVLGPINGAKDSERGCMPLSSVPIQNQSSLEGMSEYGFLCYRLAEFMNQLDVELLDIGERLPARRLRELTGKITDFRVKNKGSVGMKEMFARLCSDRELLDAFEDDVLSGCTEEEQRGIRHHLFSAMDSFRKLHMRGENTGVTVRYVPIESRETISIETVTNIVRATLPDNAREVDLYMDIQGLKAIDGNMLLSTFLLMNRRTGFRLDLKGLISSYSAKGSFAGRVEDVLKRYEIQKLITGVELFLDYGKDRQLKEYWNTMGIEDPDMDRMFVGMDCVDEGITLCNVDLIAAGIGVIKNVLSDPIEPQEKKSIYSLIVSGAIRSDYGRLLMGEEVAVPELLAWSLRKGLYQQTLTIIESKVPDDMVRRGIYYYAENEQDIARLMEAFNILYWNEPAKMRWSFEDISHYFIKFYGRFAIDFRQKKDLIARDYTKLRIDALRGRTQEILPAYSQLDNDDMLYELLLGYYRIGDLRNVINHAGADDLDVDKTGLTPRKDSREELYAALKKFIDLYRGVCAKTKKTREPVLLSSGRMKAYTRSHQLQPLESASDFTKTDSYVCQFNGKEVLIRIAMLKPEEDQEEE